MNSFEHNWNTYNLVNEWIKFADTKAGVLITLNGIIIGLVANNLTTIKNHLNAHSCLMIIFTLGFLSLITSLFFAIKCIFPNLSVGEPQSKIFFEHISKKYLDAGQFVKELESSDNNLEDLQMQIWANSKVASNKYSSVNYSIIAFSFFILFALVFIILQLINYT